MALLSNMRFGEMTTIRERSPVFRHDTAMTSTSPGIARWADSALRFMRRGECLEALVSLRQGLREQIGERCLPGPPRPAGARLKLNAAWKSFQRVCVRGNGNDGLRGLSSRRRQHG